MAIYYHGSSVLFDRFDLAHSFEGAGRAKFGFGVYVTEEYTTAAHYAYSDKHPENRDFYVYTVAIPERTEDNCLPLYKRVPVPASIVSRAEAELGGTIPAEALTEGKPFRKYLANRLTGAEGTVKQMTGKATVEGEKAAAAFLRSIGVELIEWPQGSWTNPTKRNMAVLDDAKARIIRIDRVDLAGKDHQLVPGSQRLVKEF
jgi:hypothetical protein